MTATDTARPAVPYPNKKSPVHPTKLFVRQTIHQLSALGIDISQDITASRQLFNIAKHQPERIPDLLAKVESADDQGRLIWSAALRYYGNVLIGQHREGVPDNYALISELAPYLSKQVEPKRYNRKSNEGDVVTSACYTMRDVYYALPDTDYVDALPLYKAACLVLNLEREYRRQYTSPWGRPKEHNRPPRVSRDNIEDVVFIAKNFDGVMNILPEIKRRKTYDRGMISALLDAPASALIVGVL